MIDGPLVSVVIPTYNRLEPLKRALASVLFQSYRRLEVVVVDDGSSDGTVDYLHTVDDERLKFVANEVNLGAAAARNIGIASSCGKYVAFQDSDDVWLPDKLEIQVSELESSGPDVSVSYSQVVRVDGANVALVPAIAGNTGPADIFRALLQENVVPLPAAVVRREALESTGAFDVQLPRLQEWELWLRMAESHRFIFTTTPLVVSFFSSDSISRNQAALISALRIVLEKHYEAFRRAGPSLLAGHLSALAHLEMMNGDAAAGRRYLRGALEVDPTTKARLKLLAAQLGQTAYRRLWTGIAVLRS